MKSIKSHLSLTIALFAILFMIQIFIIVVRLIDSYEIKLKNSYAVILISYAQIKPESLKRIIPSLFTLKQLSNKKILEELSDDLDKQQIILLKATLPFFYELKLDHFPKPKEIATMQSKLLNIDGIEEVENFVNRHDQVFRLLLLIKSVVNIFAVIIIVISVLLILKEMRLWQFSHQNRMHIMSLFGAPIWLRSAVLFKFAIFDTIFSTIIIIGLFLSLQLSTKVKELFDTIGVDINLINIVPEAFILFGIAFFTSMFLAFTLVFKKV